MISIAKSRTRKFWSPSQPSVVSAMANKRIRRTKIGLENDMVHEGDVDAVERSRSSSNNSLSELEKRKSRLIGPRYWREFLEYLTVKSNVFTSKVNMTFSNYWRYFRELTFIINVGRRYARSRWHLEGRLYPQQGRNQCVEGAKANCLSTPFLAPNLNAALRGVASEKGLVQQSDPEAQ
jgi:hypothetical protein